MMKTNLRKHMSAIAALIVLVAVGGCAATKPDHALNVGGMSDADYLKASPEEKEKERQRIRDGASELLNIKYERYMAGIPVPTGDKRTGFTVHREPLTGMVAVYPTNDPRGIEGAIMSGMLVTISDAEGKLIFQEGPDGQIALNPVLQYATAQDDVWRDVVRGGLNIAAAASSHSVSTLINKRVKSVDDCGGNCGGPAAVIFNEPAAIAGAAAQSAAETAVKIGMGASQPAPQKLSSFKNGI